MSQSREGFVTIIRIYNISLRNDLVVCGKLVDGGQDLVMRPVAIKTSP